MKRKHKRQCSVVLSLLLIPIFLTGCVRTTPIGAIAQLIAAVNTVSSGSQQSIDYEEDYHYNPTPSDEASGSSQTDPAGTISTTGHAQTIMVYMVGSDLESEYGNGSLDLDEMEDAYPDTEHNNILVYAGGASMWQEQDLDPEENTTLLLTDMGFETVETTPSRNMGDPDTLSQFINYCMDHYTSDSYSLILWDHGGGPVLGYGVDENYRDLLTLDELSYALDTSVGAQDMKLEWLGFDACLMNSLEVADMLAPYSNYLIASQETEPGWGWNYYFLSQLSDKVLSGEEMGRLIIDSYMDFGEYVFDAYPRLYSDLTLSCVDLQQYQDAEEALNQYFRELDASLNVQTFPQLVRSRADVRNFGTYSSAFNYGMVDAIHLLQMLGEGSSSSQAAISALESCIVYSRTNMENAGGISICYPYQTEDEYTQTCMDIQEELDFASEYTRFLRDFYAIENGEVLAEDWDVAGAKTAVSTIDEGQFTESDITLQLTPAQQANYASGGYYILCKAEAEGYITKEEDPRAEDMYLYIHGSRNVDLDENGVLHAYYKNNALYLKDADGYSNIPMILTEKDIHPNEQRYLSYVVLMRFGDDISDWASEAAQLQIVVNEDYPDGIIRNAIPLDSEEEDLQSASKQLIDLDDYDYMSVAARCSYVTRDEKGELLDFFDWEQSGIMMGFEEDLSMDYSLDVRRLEHPENYVCIFFVKDSQGNISFSDMIPLK